MKDTGTLIVISAPSGGGKTTLIRSLSDAVPHSARLITTTTRAPRDGEQDGVDYHFLSREAFEQKIQSGDFLEYVEYADHYYGTDKHELTAMLEQYIYVFAAVDVRGKQSFESARVPMFSIFLKPESVDILRERLEVRPGITENVIQERLQVAASEMAQAPHYDAVIINRQGYFEETVQAVIEVLPN